MRAKLIDLISVGDSLSLQLLKALLSIGREHSLVADIVRTQLSEAQAHSLIDAAESMSFRAIVELLWTQKHREVITDLSIVTGLFRAAAAKAKYPSQKQELSKFVAATMLRRTPDGQTWFALLSGHVFPSVEVVQSLEELIEAANETIEGINELSAILNIQPIFEPCSVSLASFLSYCGALRKSAYPHWQKVSKLLMRRAIPFLDKKDAGVLASDPELLMIAVKSPVLAAAALPFFVDQVDNLPANFWNTFDPSELVFPVSADDAIEILPGIISKCNGHSKQNLQEKVALKLFELVDEDSASQIVTNQIEKILTDQTGTVGGADVISELAKASPTTAYEVLTILTELAPIVDKQAGIRKIEQWIGDCCESNEIPVDAIAKAIYAAIDRDYANSPSGKKKAESVLIWAQKLVKRVGREIPREMFGNLADKIIATGSRVAANIIRNLSNSFAQEA
jgi:hypothetical protein